MKAKEEKKVLAVATIDEGLKQVLSEMAALVAREGFVPESVLHEQFGPQGFTQGVAMLYSAQKLFVRERKPWGTNNELTYGYRWANRIYSTKDLAKLPAEMGFVAELCKGNAPRYSNFVKVAVRCQWTNHPMGAIPKETVIGQKTGKDGAPEDIVEKINAFDRDELGNVLIPAYCPRAMVRKTCPMVGLPQSVAEHLGYQAVIIEIPTIKVHYRPIQTESGEAAGITAYEALPIGTQFVISVMLPTTALTPSKWLELLQVAGSFVHFSPGRSAGFGDFKVVAVEEEAAN